MISNKMLREFALIHPMASAPLALFRKRIEKGRFENFAELLAGFSGVDKVGDVFVFNIGGNKYRLVAGIAFAVQTVWIKAVMTHAEYDGEKWK